MDDLGKTILQVVSGGLVAAFGGLIGMFAKVKELDSRMRAVESHGAEEEEKIDRIDRTVIGLESTVSNFGDKLSDIKDGQENMVERLFKLLKGGPHD